MSLLRDQKNRTNQTIQQVKELARNGQWQEAKQLVDTLPDTPDIIRIRERIEKQLFITTGEIPAVMENSKAVADMDESIGTKAPASKVKKPQKAPLNIGNAILHFMSAIVLIWGVITFFSASGVPGQYSLYNATAPQITQVYTEATFEMAKSIALFALVAVLQVSSLTRRV